MKFRFSHLWILILLVFFMGVNDCSQQSHMNMRYVRNVVGAPVLALKRWVEGKASGAINNRFETYLKKLKIDHQLQIDFKKLLTERGVGAILNCKRHLGGLDLPGVGPLLEGMSNKYCSCQLWDEPIVNCQAQCCSVLCDHKTRCELTCPDSLSLLRKHKKRATPSLENTLAFENSAFDVYASELRSVPPENPKESFKAPTAYNFGHISVRRKFNQLAFFKAAKKMNFSNDSDRRKFYENKIDEICDGKAAEIPGYANLHDFSKDPMVQKHLKYKIAQEWLDKSIGNGLSEKKVDPSIEMNALNTKQFLLDVEQKVDILGSTTIEFGYKPGRQDGENEISQSLEVFKVLRRKDQTFLCIYDPNLPVEAFVSTDEICFPHLELLPKGGVYYVNKFRKRLDKLKKVDGGIPIRFEDIVQKRELYDVRVDHDGDERDAIIQVQQLREYCLDTRGCQDV